MHEDGTADDEVELISDGENLLIIGHDRRAVETFLRSKGLLDRAREIGTQQLAPMLRSASELTRSVAETVAESGLWVKMTPESAEAIAKYGLTETDVPGITHAMAGGPGDIKKWLQIDTTAQAKLSNPVMLSGVAGALSQAARQQEAAQLRALLATLDEKLDQVLRGQWDEILGDLSGVERHLKASRIALDVQGEVDSLEWDKLSAVPLEVRKIQAKAVLKLGGIADDMEKSKRVTDLNNRLPAARLEVQLWLRAIARCIAALDDHAALELARVAAIEPQKLDAKRQAIALDREVAIGELNQAVAVLMDRMSEIAGLANTNVILNGSKVTTVLATIEDTREAVKWLYDALGLEIDWDSIAPEQWLAAIRQAQQWKNAFAEGRAVAWDKGKPYIGTVAVAAVGYVLRVVTKGGKPSV